MTDSDEHEKTPTSVRDDLAEALTWSAHAGQAMYRVEVLIGEGAGAGGE